MTTAPDGDLTAGEALQFTPFGKPPERLFGEYEAIVHRDLEHAPARLHELGVGAELRDQVISRAHGARFVASSTAVFDSDSHRDRLRGSFVQHIQNPDSRTPGSGTKKTRSSHPRAVMEPMPE